MYTYTHVYTFACINTNMFFTHVQIYTHIIRYACCNFQTDLLVHLHSAFVYSRVYAHMCVHTCPAKICPFTDVLLCLFLVYVSL